ncbi:MAG: hypothetical protein HY074_14135 [Deltaproteobacteria bacterium]|nr:hypothetical protein [Deltaproteobacteria bacterium]
MIDKFGVRWQFPRDNRQEPENVSVSKSRH